MQTYLDIASLVLSVVLISLILLQQRGTGLGGAFGGDSSSFQTRRGVERILFIVTIIVAILFFGLGIAGLVIS